MVDPASFKIQIKRLQASERTLTMCIAARRQMSDIKTVEVISSVMLSKHHGEVQLWLHPDDKPHASREIHVHTSKLMDHSQQDLDSAIAEHVGYWRRFSDLYDADADEQHRIDKINLQQEELDQQMRQSIRNTKLKFNWQGGDCQEVGSGESCKS
jgi:hypothetical protein